MLPECEARVLTMRHRSWDPNCVGVSRRVRKLEWVQLGCRSIVEEGGQVFVRVASVGMSAERCGAAE